MNTQNPNFFIDHPNEKHGWSHCYLTFDGLSHRLDASGAMPPFHHLLDFLRSIALRRLPAWFYWDEEGYGPYFEAWPLSEPDDGADFHLRIIHDAHDIHWTGEEEEEDRRALVNTYQVLWVDADLNRQTVIDVFLTALRDFVLYSQRPDSWEIRLADLAAFEHLRARTIQPRSDITHAEPVDLIISRWQDDEEQIGSQSLELRMWDMELSSWSLDDTDAFWPAWFALLEHAMDRQPFEMSFTNMRVLRLNREFVADGTMSPKEAERDWSTRIQVTPLNHLCHFRLQIFETDYRYTNFLKVDEVIDAFQLTGVFLKEFEDLLSEGYQSYPDEDGQLFDLHDLPYKELQSRVKPKL